VAVYLDLGISAAHYPDFFYLEEGIAKKLDRSILIGAQSIRE